MPNSRLKNYYRDRREHVEISELENLLPAEETDLEHAAWLEQLRGVLADRLECLPERQKMIALLFFREKDYDAIADTLGMTAVYCPETGTVLTMFVSPNTEVSTGDPPAICKTVLGESSGTISGGQRQRILIARAIINRPAVLIFDEATSALDNVTQAAACERLERMKVTRIVAAHRLSTVRNCDRILALDNGKIAEEGSCESLMAKNGLFCQFASRQTL